MVLMRCSSALATVKLDNWPNYNPIKIEEKQQLCPADIISN